MLFCYFGLLIIMIFVEKFWKNRNFFVVLARYSKISTNFIGVNSNI